MTHAKHLLVMLVVVLAATFVALPADAKPVKTRHLYMFGFSASFKDSVIYVTTIQDVQGAWIDNKSKFLRHRDSYSSQLKEFLTDSLQQPGRVCLVMFSVKKRKAEKQYLKLMKKYKKGYDVRYLNEKQFLFRPLDEEEEQGQ